MEITTADGLGVVYAYLERFTSSLADPVLDSVLLVIATDDVDLSGQVQVDILPTLTSGGHFFPDESNPIATFFIDASRLIRDDLAEVILDCSALRLQTKHFMVSVKQHTLSSRVYVVFDHKTEDVQRDIDDELDRSYFAYLDEDQVAYTGFLGGMFMGAAETFLYSNMMAIAYLHQFGTGTISTQWKHSVAGSGEDKINSLIRTADGGHLFVGSTNSSDGDIGANKGGLDYIVGKYDKTGKKQWIKTFGGSKDDIAFGATEFFGSKYVIAGSSTSIDGDVGPHLGTSCAWVLTLDKDGNVLQSKAYGGGGDGIRAYSIASDYSSGDEAVVIAGWADPYQITHTAGSFNHYLGGPWLAKIKANGDTLWTQSLGGANVGPVKHPHAMQVGTLGMIAFATENSEFEKTIQLLNAQGVPGKTLKLPARASEQLAYAGVGSFATMLEDTLLIFNVLGEYSNKFAIEGLSDVQSLDAVIDQGFVITGKSRRVGETIEYPSLFTIDAQGYTRKIVKLDTANTNIVGVIADGDGYVLGRNDHPSLKRNIELLRLAAPAAVAPVATAVSLIEACRGDLLDIPVTVKSGIYPITAKFTEGFGTPIVSDMVLRGPSDGDEFVLHYVAAQNSLINVRVTDASGASTELPINVTLGIEERPVVTQQGSMLTSSVAGESYQWIDIANQPVPLATNKSFTPLTNGEYAVVVSAKECVDTSAFFTYTSAGVNDQASVNESIRFAVSAKHIDVENSEGRSGLTLSVFNALGQQLMIEPLGRSSRIDLANYVKGAYFLEVRDAGRVIASRRFIR
jgi:hypothetical protein